MSANMVIPRFHNRKPGNQSLILLVLALSASLIWVGCLFWINNSIALIPDSDLHTYFNIELIQGFDNAKHDHRFEAVGHASGPFDGAPLFVRGNGDVDDNREPVFVFKRPAGVALAPNAINVASNFNERRTVAAYKDFGNLKVMPVGNAISSVASITSFIIFKRPLVYLREAFMLLGSVNMVICRFDYVYWLQQKRDQYCLATPMI